MRKILLAWCLPLLMLLAQQGVLAHELSHLRASPGSSQGEGEPGKQAAADTICLSCLSHADLSGLARADDFRLPLADFAHARPGSPGFVAIAAQALAPRSRGPPDFL